MVGKRYNEYAVQGDYKGASFEKLCERLASEILRLSNSPPAVEINASLFLSTQMAEVNGKVRVFMASFRGLESNEVAQQLPGRNIRMVFPARQNSKLHVLPFLGDAGELEGEWSHGRITFTIPEVTRGMAVGVTFVGSETPVKVRICAPSQTVLAVTLGFLMALPGDLSTLAAAVFASPMQVESPPQATSTTPSLVGVRPGTKIIAELQTALDVLATRSGDEIAVRVTNNLKRDGRVVVHEGDRLVGRVTSVRPQSVGKGEKGSEVAIVFDRLMSRANTYRLNTFVHRVVWMPGQGARTPTGTDETPSPPQHTQVLRGPHPGMTGGLGVTASQGGAGHAAGKNGSNGGYPRGGLGPPDFVEARSRRAPDGRAGGVSVLTNRQGNLRLGAGTLLDFRTQSP